MGRYRYSASALLLRHRLRKEILHPGDQARRVGVHGPPLIGGEVGLVLLFPRLVPFAPLHPDELAGRFAGPCPDDPEAELLPERPDLFAPLVDKPGELSLVDGIDAHLLPLDRVPSATCSMISPIRADVSASVA